MELILPPPPHSFSHRVHEGYTKLSNKCPYTITGAGRKDIRTISTLLFEVSSCLRKRLLRTKCKMDAPRSAYPLPQDRSRTIHNGEKVSSIHTESTSHRPLHYTNAALMQPLHLLFLKRCHFTVLLTSVLAPILQILLHVKPANSPSLGEN